MPRLSLIFKIAPEVLLPKALLGNLCEFIAIYWIDRNMKES